MTIPCLVFFPKKFQSLPKAWTRISTLAQAMGYLLLIMIMI